MMLSAKLNVPKSLLHLVRMDDQIIVPPEGRLEEFGNHDVSGLGNMLLSDPSSRVSLHRLEENEIDKGACAGLNINMGEALYDLQKMNAINNLSANEGAVLE